MDYSLPYDEYLKNFRKTHHPSAQAMSEDQYNFNKAAAEKQAKMKAAEESGNGNWWEQKTESEKLIENLVGKENPTHEEAMSKIQEIAEQRLTPEQQGIQAKGNKGDDHINHPNEADTADLVKVQQAREKLYGQKDSYTPEEIEAAKNEAGITKNVPGSTSANNTANTALTDSVSDVATPKEDDPPEVHNAKGKYNKSMMSIWDAYRNGDIDKETAGYFTIDAIATLAKNLGRSIGNVGAQFSGGTIDNGHDTSMWEQRRDSMFNTELQKETEGVDTFENKFKQLSYNRNSTINDLIEAVKSDADKLSDDNPLKIAYLSLAAMIASGQVDGTTTIAATGAKGITELFNLFKGKDKK